MQRLMEQPYSNREVDHMRNDIDKNLRLILEQTTQHNHRMTKIEKWQSYTQGALAVLGIFVVPCLGWVLFQIVNLGNLDDKISIGVSKALSEYEINIK